MYHKLVQKDFELSRQLISAKGIKKIVIKIEKRIINLMIQ
jgi:hypothetical protein